MNEVIANQARAEYDQALAAAQAWHNEKAGHDRFAVGPALALAFATTAGEDITEFGYTIEWYGSGRSIVKTAPYADQLTLDDSGTGGQIRISWDGIEVARFPVTTEPALILVFIHTLIDFKI